VTYLFAGLATSDFQTGVQWYTGLLGRPPDRFPHSEEAVWQVTERGLIYLVLDPRRAGGGLLALMVDDLDAELRRLATQGVHWGEIELVGRGVRKTVVSDPDGNQITLGQAP
jgi:catechol 2,3-dioxygenase-like lactoylglutathione lyase family enzyme